MMVADHEVDDVRQEIEALRAAFASEQEKASTLEDVFAGFFTGGQQRKRSYILYPAALAKRFGNGTTSTWPTGRRLRMSRT